MKPSLVFLSLGTMIALCVGSPAFGQFSLLHEFAGGGDDGGNPYYGSLTLSESTLYGMTPYGGDGDKGVIFSIGTGGSGFTLLHEFAGGVNDGGGPEGSLTLSGSTLYGMTYEGGDAARGVIFSIGTGGSGFTLLHEFAGGVDDGGWPQGSLTLSGSTLYGMTPFGGDANKGVIFSIGTGGSGFTLLHEFATGVADGGYPYGSLTLSGSTLYGMTQNGGDADAGVIFSIGTGGSGFTLLHEFAGDDGSYPEGSLTLSGSLLCGMTRSGGDAYAGVIFSIGTGGSGFTLLHEFATGVDDGESPHGSLTLSGSTLYGMTCYGGDADAGVLFSYTDPSLPVELSSFTAAVGDGTVTLRWVTESEVGHVGFHIYRALVEDGIYQRITAKLIEGVGTSIGRREYAFTDPNLTNGVTYWYKLEDVGLDGTTEMHGPISVTPEGEVFTPVEAAGVQALPAEFGLAQNVPNPFNPTTTIAYDLPEAGDVTLTICTVTGQEVATLASGHQEAGHYEVRWDGSGFANGVYLYRLEAGDFVETRRMLLLK